MADLAENRRFAGRLVLAAENSRAEMNNAGDRVSSSQLAFIDSDVGVLSQPCGYSPSRISDDY
jgi:hypothetical protein